MPAASLLPATAARLSDDAMKNVKLKENRWAIEGRHQRRFTAGGGAAAGPSAQRPDLRISLRGRDHRFRARRSRWTHHHPLSSVAAGRKTRRRQDRFRQEAVSGFRPTEHLAHRLFSGRWRGVRWN